MNKHNITYLSYGLTIAAVVVWIAVLYFAYFIQSEHAAYGARRAEAALLSDQATTNARLHVLANDNLAQSALLDALVTPDVSSIITTINSVGAASGVSIKISGALPVTLPKTQKDIHAVAFIIEGTGSFSALMHALALFEVLPAASSIDTVDLSQIPSTGSVTSHARQSWHMNLKMQVLTTSVVSS